MRVFFDRFSPYIFGALGLFGFLRWNSAIQQALISNNVNLREIVSTTFDVSTLFTGLLFSIYVLAIAPGGGFIERIFSTKTFALFKRYTVEAMILGTLASIISAILRSLKDPPKSTDEVWIIAISFWGAITISSMLGFFRVVNAFFVLAQQDRR